MKIKIEKIAQNHELPIENQQKKISKKIKINGFQARSGNNNDNISLYS